MPIGGFPAGRDSWNDGIGRRVGRAAREQQQRHPKSINKRNGDTGELSKPSQGNALPTGTGTHDVNRRRAGGAAEDRQRRGVEGRKTGPLPPIGVPEDMCVRDPDEKMTPDQAEHLRILSEEAGEEFDPSLTRDAAERQIRRLQHRAGFKP